MGRAITNLEELINRIEFFGMIVGGKYKGYIKLNKRQWERVKSEVSHKKQNEKN